MDVLAFSRVAVTPEAADLLRRLREDHGPLMFHQSGGCCDGSSLTIDVVPGRGAGFSLEAPHGVRFLLRSRLLTDEEVGAFHPR